MPIAEGQLKRVQRFLEADIITTGRPAAVIHEGHHVNAPMPVVGVSEVVGPQRYRAISRPSNETR